MSMLTEAQKTAYRHKLEHSWNVTNFEKEFDYTRKELREAEEAYREGDMQHMVEELADVAIFLMGIAEMAHLDLGEAIAKKQMVVGSRTYGSIHVLKCAGFFPPDEKTFEYRKDDRGYKVGDTILCYKVGDGRNWKAGRITYILRNKPEFGLPEGYCVLTVVWLPTSDVEECRQLASERGLLKECGTPTDTPSPFLRSHAEACGERNVCDITLLKGASNNSDILQKGLGGV